MDVNHSNDRPTYCFVVHKYNLNGKQQPNQHFSLSFFQQFFIFILIHKFFCACYTECSRARKMSKKCGHFVNVFLFIIYSCWIRFWHRFCGPREIRSRTVHLGKPTFGQFPANAIRNQKYNIITFLPLVLFQQFKFFLNLYFLIMACSQFVPELRIGYLYTYWGPLVSYFFIFFASIFYGF